MSDYIVNVEGAIVNNGRFLLVVRGEGETHAAGTLSLIGGKVEASGVEDNVLEKTLRREILEEVGLEVADDITYLESNAFVSDDGDPVVDIVFLCRYVSGTPEIGDIAEVASWHWMTADEVIAHPNAPAWTQRSIAKAEQKRLALGL